MALIDIQAAAEAIGLPVPSWEGKCYVIASLFVQKGLLPRGSVAVYGHWVGPVEEGTYFHRRRSHPFVQHGWCVLPDGRVCDPTRFVFEGATPYVYLGESDYYDEGGNTMRHHSLRPCPFPGSGSNAAQNAPTALHEKLPEGALILVERLIPFESPWSFHQVHWLVNVPLELLEEHAHAVFEAVCAVGVGGFIPLDNKRKAERENLLRVGPGPGKCWNCGKDCDESAYCHGCREYICDCGSGDLPVGEHEPDDHFDDVGLDESEWDDEEWSYQDVEAEHV